MTIDQLKNLEAAYPSVNQNMEGWAIITLGRLGFRYGPFTPAEIGKLMTQSLEEGLAIVFTFNCGPEFDWEFARDACPRLIPEEEPGDDSPSLREEVEARMADRGVDDQ
jgi:hypothetical protein